MTAYQYQLERLTWKLAHCVRMARMHNQYHIYKAPGANQKTWKRLRDEAMQDARYWKGELDKFLAIHAA